MPRNFALAAVVFLAAAALGGQNSAPNPAPNSAPNSDPNPDPNPWQTQPGKRVFRYQFASSPSGSPAQVFPILNPTGPSCPVTMRAEHRSGGSAMYTGYGGATGVGQRIHLIFGALSARVTAATVTVRGTDGQWRVATASTRQPRQGSPYISRTLNAVFAQYGDGFEATELDLPGFTSVKSIRLDSVTYADGSTWTAPEGGVCRVAPDPLMLVSGR